MRFLHNTTYKMLLALLTMAVGLTACNNHLTDEPETAINTEEAFNSVDKLKRNALLTVYNYIGASKEGEGLQGTERGVYDLNSLTTDEQIIPVRGSDWYDGGLWMRLFMHKWTAGEAPIGNAWNYLYKVVIMCNEGIERIDAYETTDVMEKAKLAEYRAELRALRAMYYYYLMDLFGRVPLVTATGVKSNEMTLCERKEMFYWIYNEMNEAIPILAMEYSQLPKTEYYGRMTAFVAYFVMMKLAINAEVYTDNNWTDDSRPDGKDIMLTTYNIFNLENMEMNAWETVRGILNIIKAYYELSDDYNANFDITNESSHENIFVIPMDNSLYANKYNYIVRSRHYCHGAAFGGDGYNGTCATITAVKAYGYGLGSYDTDIRLGYNLFYDNVMVDGNLVYEDDGLTPLNYKPMAITEYNLTGKPYEKTAGARLAKYASITTHQNDGRLGNNDIVLFRYADALLMYAEASYRLGDISNAKGAMNAVYYRSNGNRYDTINDDILLNERMKELMWEGWRRNDLIRFGRFHKPYDLKTEDWSESETDGHTIVFPIPGDMMIMHPDWKQNPGY